MYDFILSSPDHFLSFTLLVYHKIEIFQCHSDQIARYFSKDKFIPLK